MPRPPAIHDVLIARLALPLGDVVVAEVRAGRWRGVAAAPFERAAWPLAAALAHELIGEDPVAWAPRWDRFAAHHLRLADRHAWSAFGLLETAAAELSARAAGLPLAGWLGGTARSHVPIAHRVGAEAPLEGLLSAFTSTRCRAITVAASGSEWEPAAERVEALRAALGPGARLRLALGQSPAPAELRILGRVLPRLRLDFIETPPIDAVADAGIESWPPLARRAVRTGWPALAREIRDGSVQVLVVEPLAWGGPAAVQRIDGISHAFQLELAVAAETPLALSRSLAAHLAASHPRATQPLELPAASSSFDFEDIDDEVADRAGFAAPRSAPGSGIVIDWDRAHRHVLDRLAVGAPEVFPEAAPA